MTRCRAVEIDFYCPLVPLSLRTCEHEKERKVQCTRQFTDVNLIICILDHLTSIFYTQGVDGPSSVYVNVICDRKRTTDLVRTAIWYLQTEAQLRAYPSNPSMKYKHFLPYISQLRILLESTAYFNLKTVNISKAWSKYFTYKQLTS